MLPPDQCDRLEVVLVSPRNPLNIGAAARAMANFGFERLSIVAPFAVNWMEAKSAVGAPDLLREARVFDTLAEAVKDCTLVLGTGSLDRRRPEQAILTLPEAATLLRQTLANDQTQQVGAPGLASETWDPGVSKSREWDKPDSWFKYQSSCSPQHSCAFRNFPLCKTSYTAQRTLEFPPEYMRYPDVHPCTQ